MPRNTDIDLKVINVNRKKVGEVKVYKPNFRKMILIGSAAVLFTTGFAAGRVTKPTYERVISRNVELNMEEEQRFNGIPYEVKSGDTLLGIIYEYETDVDKVYKYKDDIMYFNEISSYLDKGDVINLVGVPASKLENYGFTANYNYFEPNIEVEDRLEFFANLVESNTLDEVYVDQINRLAHNYRDFKYNSLNDVESERVLDFILEELRSLDEKLHETYGYTFEKNKIARPLSLATRNVEMKMSY